MLLWMLFLIFLIPKDPLQLHEIVPVCTTLQNLAKFESFLFIGALKANVLMGADWCPVILNKIGHIRL